MLEAETRVRATTAGAACLHAARSYQSSLGKTARTALRSHITTTETDDPKLRTFVNDFFTSGLEYNSAGVLSVTIETSANNVVVPMDVGVLSYGKGEGAGDQRTSEMSSRKQRKGQGQRKVQD